MDNDELQNTINNSVAVCTATAITCLTIFIFTLAIGFIRCIF